MRQICDMGHDGFTSLPKEGVLRIIFFALKNPTASAGFEPANLVFLPSLRNSSFLLFVISFFLLSCYFIVFLLSLHAQTPYLIFIIPSSFPLHSVTPILSHYLSISEAHSDVDVLSSGLRQTEEHYFVLTFPKFRPLVLLIRVVSMRDEYRALVK
jgi:hypothetical protein